MGFSGEERLRAVVEVPADAASRPQDQSFFEGWYQAERLPDLSMAAQLMGNPLSRPLCRT